MEVHLDSLSEHDHMVVGGIAANERDQAPNPAIKLIRQCQMWRSLPG